MKRSRGLLCLTHTVLCFPIYKQRHEVIKLTRVIKRINKYKYMLLILPALLFYSGGLIYPLLFGTIKSSFYNWNMLEPFKKWIGFANYRMLFTDDSQFISALWFTLKYGFFIVIIGNVLALLVAIILNEKIILRNLVRSLFFVPYIISSVFVALIWVFILTGAFPSIMKAIGVDWKLSWFGSPGMAMLALIIVTTWHLLGFKIILYLAGLQTIPKEVIEAGEIDGATGFRRMIYIQLPLLMPTVTICLFISISGTFKHFDIPYALTGGGPFNSTETIAINIYREAFQAYNLGYSSAKAVILLLIVCVLTFIQLKLSREKEVQL
jgi:raffinose/stachyose/melibiose transport system permease protein